jgi:hypothetical protein
VSYALTDYYNAVGYWVPTLASLNITGVYAQINKARRTLAKETDATITTYNFPFVVGTQSYVFPTVNGCTMQYIMETYYYMGNMRVPLKGSLPRVLIGSDWYLGFQGWPLSYYDLNGSVYYYPVPYYAYSAYLKGKVEPIDLTTGGGADSIIPLPFQDAVIPLAAKYCALMDGTIELANAMEIEYMKGLSKLPREFM